MQDESGELARVCRADVDCAFHVLHMRAEEGCRLLAGHGDGGAVVRSIRG